MGKLTVALVVAAVAALSVATTIVVAGDGPSDMPTAVDELQTTGSGGAICRFGFDARTGLLSNPGAHIVASVTLTKKCAGHVTGEFATEAETEIFGSGAGEINAHMQATCTGTGGFTNPCSVGQSIWALPANMMLSYGNSFFGARSIAQVWPSLRPGVWRFDVWVNIVNNGILGDRTLLVNAYK
jgi:hypothetical protein